MGIAKILQSIGLTRKAAAAPVEEIKDPVAGKLISDKEKLEGKKEKLENETRAVESQIGVIEQQMATKEPMLSELQPQESTKEISMETKPAAEEPKVEAPAAPETPVQANKTVKAEAKPFEGKETPAEEKAEAKAEEKVEKAEEKKAAFNIHFVKGDTFDKSFFVAEDNGDFHAVKSSRIIPVEYQTRILRALASTGRAPEDVASPSDLIEQMLSQGVNSIASFRAATDAMAAQSSRKTAGFFAMSESEIPAPAKAGEAPLMASMQSEAEAGRKALPLPAGSSSPVRQYYGRLPGSAAGGQEPVKALNPQSMRDKVDFMRHALEELKAKNEMLEEKAKSAEKEADGLKKEKEDAGANMMLESVVKDLLAKKLIDAKDEQAAISALAKIDRKCLPQVVSLLKLLGKAEKGGMSADLEEKKPFAGPEKVAKASVVIPRQFLNENEPDVVNGMDFLANNW